MGSEDVVNCAAENAEDREGGVKGGEGIVRGGVVDLAAATHAGESIEHAGTTETNQADKNDLGEWGIVSEREGGYEFSGIVVVNGHLDLGI